MLYPRGGMAQAIAPGGTLQVGMRDGEKIVLSLPKDYPYVVDPSAPASSGGVETFKVFITTEQADFRMLEQAAVRGGKEVRSDSRGLQRLLATASGGMILRDAMVFGEDTDWTTIETTFRLERKQQPISNTGVTVIGPVVKIEPHPALKGKARIAEVSSGGKDLGPGLPAGLSLLQLGPSGQARSLEPGAATPATVIELLEVEDASVVTRNAPLRITVQAPLSKQEVALPMGWDGEFLLPLGRLESRTGNSLTFALEHLPDPTASGEKSLFGSIKIFFQKTLSQALGWDYPYPRLDAPIIQLEENKVTYNNLPVDVLRSKVAAADRVVVFVHGIIGDTVGMALMAPHCGLPMDDPKTLILTFDYENLNTGIEATGRKLGEKLTAIGLTPDHGKKLFIVAHSMGGLVSRWFIEHEDGGLVVTRLITLGTPHLGSPWSKTIDMALFGLSLAFNKLGHAFWPAHLIGGLAAGVQKIDVMLDEMGVGSDFIKRLADTGSLPIPPVPYTLVCGNTTLIAAAQDAGKMEALFARLFSKNTLYSGLTPLFGGSPNDIAVNVASSRADTLPVSWQLDRHEVPSDHLIYFENPETCAIVRQAIS